MEFKDEAQRARREIAAVFATALLFQLFANLLDLKLPFLVAACAIWTVYVVRRVRAGPGVLASWGLDRGAWRRGARQGVIVLVAGAALLVAWRLVAGWQGLPLGCLGILALYPVWSVIQEFVVQGLLVKNLRALGLRRGPTILLGGALFSLAHFPDPQLMALTLLPGFAWAWLFLRTRALIPIALCHAWLGTLAFYWVLERDPWTKLFPGAS